MNTIAKKLNELLVMFDTRDAVYRSVVSNEDGVPNPTITKPTDFNIGAIADLLEWNRRLTISLQKQIFLNQASGNLLDEFCLTMFNIYRNEGETDAEFAERVRQYILSHRLSPASIIKAVERYSSLLPEIIEGQIDSAFSDVIFSDIYFSAWQHVEPAPDPYAGWWFLPAITCGADGGEFFFILVMYNLAPEDVLTVVDIVDEWKAAGVGYMIEVRYV